MTNILKLKVTPLPTSVVICPPPAFDFRTFIKPSYVCHITRYLEFLESSLSIALLLSYSLAEISRTACIFLNHHLLPFYVPYQGKKNIYVNDEENQKRLLFDLKSNFFFFLK